MNYKGTIHRVLDTQQVSEKFKKRELILTDNDPKFPNFISFQFTQKNVDLLDGLNVGDEAEVTFNLRGRVWKSPKGETRYFNTLDAFRISISGKRSVAPEPFEITPDDDLPF